VHPSPLHIHRNRTIGDPVRRSHTAVRVAASTGTCNDPARFAIRISVLMSVGTCDSHGRAGATPNSRLAPTMLEPGIAYAAHPAIARGATSWARSAGGSNTAR
jgi:hypothetical protein